MSAKGEMADDTITLAQISDLHLPSYGWTPPRYWNMKRGLGSLNWHRQRRFVHRLEVADLMAEDLRRLAPDHVAVTGDIVNIGLPREFQAGLRWLHKLGDPGDVMVIPGNHDIYSTLPGRDMCLSFWHDYMRADAYGQALAGRLGHITRFPYVRRVGPLALIGVNSARPTPPFVAAGRVGQAQMQRLEEILAALKADGLVRVVLIHHPPLPGLTSQRRALEDAAQLSELLGRQGADLVLYGHNHHDALSWLDGPDGAIAVCGAASGSAGRPHKGEPPARYYLYQVMVRGSQIEILRTVRGLGNEQDRIIEISRQLLVPGCSLAGVSSTA